MADSPTLSRNSLLADAVVFVDGIMRTGKSMLGPILASFDRVELERVEEIFEYVGTLHRLGKIDSEAAVALLKLECDMHLYNSSIGRNVNFRFSDHSSVWRNPNRLRYFKRLFGKQGEPIAQRIRRERPIFQNQTHDQLANFDLYHAAFGASFRILEMIRHPVDVVDSWVQRGWGTRFGTDPLALTFSIRFEGQDLPYYALGLESDYVATSPNGRVIRMVSRLWDDSIGVYRNLSQEQQSQVLVIPFEGFVRRPDLYLQPIAHFLGSAATRHTPSALRRQGCPRPYSPETRERKQRSIEGEASPEELALLNRLIEEYETLSKAVAVPGM